MQIKFLKPILIESPQFHYAKDSFKPLYNNPINCFIGQESIHGVEEKVDPTKIPAESVRAFGVKSCHKHCKS
jgi:hypothetical protein